jgi:pimeloyl-ACP methyl ester carboxylesterase
VPVKESRQLSEILSNAKLSILPGAGHVPTMTRPQEIAHEIMNFFGSDT